MIGFRKNRGTGRFGLFAELLIIITGIMVSFLLNEWRENKNTEEKKLVLLKEIQQDLKIDSIYLDLSTKIYHELERSHDSMLTFPKQRFHQDSITQYLDCFISYYPFKPTNRAFNTLNNDPEIIISIGDTSGLDYLINQYSLIRSQLYNVMQEWEDIDKQFVLNTTLPYLEKNAPYMVAPLNKSFHGDVYYSVSKEDHFKNLVKSGKLYKSVLSKNYKQTSEIVRNLQEKIREQLLSEDSKK